MKAVRGIATFKSVIPLVPSVYVTNATSGAPYVSNVSFLPRVCCARSWWAYPSDPNAAKHAYSEPFQTLSKSLLYDSKT